MKVNYLINNVDKETREAIWQYLMDHSQIMPNGYWGVQLYFDSEEDFWNRVQARKDGDFKRYELTDKITTQLKRKRMFQAFLNSQRRSDRFNKIVTRIDLGNNILEKTILLVYRKTRKMLFNE